jgi:DNA (cytosine-5)-methyltransferase 1
MIPLTYVELFAGAGGLSLGLEMAGWRCLGHAEWDAFPRRILTHRWPDVPLWGDVTTLTGADITANGIPTLLSGGSPCQDLSVAGKRAGLDGDRSSLFFHQLRLWEESGAPYCLWENVLGAFSSNAGGDFAAVLSSFVGSPVAVPRDGWAKSGVAAGATGVAAWRVLDAQYFGVPQRRRRVFVLGTRTGGCDPAEVLALTESLSGHPEPRRETREGIADDARSGVESTIRYLTGWDAQSKRVFTSAGDTPALQAAERSGQQQPAVVQVARTTDYTPIVFTKRQYGAYDNSPSVDATLGARDHASQNTDIVVGAMNRLGAPGAPTAADGYIIPQVAPPLNTTQFAKHAGSNQNVAELAQLLPVTGRPRRLTPLECERLMGWPDGWTDVPSEKGKPAADSARYKACGNGVASPVAAWIGFRLRDAITAVSR